MSSGRGSSALATTSPVSAHLLSEFLHRQYCRSEKSSVSSIGSFAKYTASSRQTCAFRGVRTAAPSPLCTTPLPLPAGALAMRSRGLFSSRDEGLRGLLADGSPDTTSRSPDTRAADSEDPGVVPASPTQGRSPLPKISISSSARAFNVRLPFTHSSYKNDFRLGSSSTKIRFIFRVALPFTLHHLLHL